MTQVLHRERQHPAAWVHVVIVVAVGGAILSHFLTPEEASPWLMVIPGLILVAFYALFAPMSVEIDADAMHVRFGRIGWPHWVFPPDEVGDPRVVEFRPLIEYGGWGIRRGRGGYCLNQRGNRGVRFEHAGGTYTVGSDNPERLLAALRSVIRRDAGLDR